MSWKKNPTEGILLGHISKQKSGAPIVDAYVTVEGQEKSALSSADGFYALLKLDPGTYTVKARRGGGEAIAENIEIKPGTVTTVDLKM